jgi:uncharacterized protein HemX
MTTERRVEHPDGTVEHVSTSENPTVIERRSGGGMGFLGIIIAVLAIGVVGYFLFTMSQSQQVENNAVAGAAQSVGNAAESVGNAAERAVPGGD